VDICRERALPSREVRPGIKGKKTRIFGGLGMGIQKPLIDGERISRVGVASAVTFGTTLVFSRPFRPERGKPLIIGIVLFVMPVQRNDDILLPFSRLDRPSDEVAFRPGCYIQLAFERIREFKNERTILP
jgi:hypothetical protein